jgi:hypothetical protein
MQRHHAFTLGDGGGDDMDFRIPAVQQSQNADQRGLRLDRDDVRAEPTPRADAVADVGAEIEAEVARPDQPRVERVHDREAPRPAVVDRERTGHAVACLH